MFGDNNTKALGQQAAATYTGRGSSHTLCGDNGDTSDGGNAVTGAADAASTVGNIIQITVVTFVALAI